jgi:hypothetical protein
MGELRGEQLRVRLPPGVPVARCLSKGLHMSGSFRGKGYPATDGRLVVGMIIPQAR